LVRFFDDGDAEQVHAIGERGGDLSTHVRRHWP
jgi:hypothetical protein